MITVPCETPDPVTFWPTIRVPDEMIVALRTAPLAGEAVIDPDDVEMGVKLTE